jgi:hypothetical protein
MLNDNDSVSTIRFYILTLITTIKKIIDTHVLILMKSQSNTSIINTHVVLQTK